MVTFLDLWSVKTVSLTVRSYILIKRKFVVVVVVVVVYEKLTSATYTRLSIDIDIYRAYM